MIQTKTSLDAFHSSEDPWGYENNNEDFNRKEILLSLLPAKHYQNVLDIGCGQGFITKDLPGENVWGVDISETAIAFAKKNIHADKINFKQGSIFELDKLFDFKFDLLIITGVMYPQYIGNASSLIYLLMDKLLKSGGVLVSVHINEWYDCQFPYIKTKQHFYMYKEFMHTLEIYYK